MVFSSLHNYRERVFEKSGSCRQNDHGSKKTEKPCGTMQNFMTISSSGDLDIWNSSTSFLVERTKTWFLHNICTLKIGVVLIHTFYRRPQKICRGRNHGRVQKILIRRVHHGST